MKLARMIIAVACLLGFAATLQAQTCNVNLPGTTPTSEFTNNLDGTVTHTRTGLMWQRCAVGLSGAACTAGTAGNFAGVNWSTVLKAAVGDRTAGYSDWRLPNVKELESIVENKCNSPSINTSVFPNTPATYFWSSSVFANGSGYAWVVTFVSGSVGNGGYQGNSLLVRLVRAGRSFGSFDSLNPGAQSMLTVSVVGSAGSGTVTSSPAGINCGATCNANYSNGTSVTLTAVPGSGSVFTGWGSSCSGNSATCTLTMNVAETVSAVFDRVLTVPGVPSMVSIISGPGRVTLSLLAPSDTGGGAIVSYSATCSAVGHGAVTASSSTTTVVVPGLVPGVSYTCSATASNGSYTSLATPASAPVIPKPKANLTPILMLLLD